MLYFTVLFIVIVTTATTSFVKADFSNEEKLEKVLQSLQSQQQLEGSERTDALGNFLKLLEPQHGSVLNFGTFENTEKRPAEVLKGESHYVLLKNQQQNLEPEATKQSYVFKPKGEVQDQRFNNEQRHNQDALLQLFSKTKLPNNLLSNGLNNRQYDEGSGGNQLDLEKYSKVYVVLNPQAFNENRSQGKKEVPKLSDLVTDGLTSIQKRRKDKDELKDYESYNRAKGFVVDVRPSQMRRWNRNNDGANRRDDDTDDFPKRPRHGYRGGGGSRGSGRTGIPYVKQRGDIYEKPE